jgi:L,D-peptidoglycan transpeptidase YkuD (ErfK/YbiS/YcfS/YnhG family)
VVRAFSLGALRRKPLSYHPQMRTLFFLLFIATFASAQQNPLIAKSTKLIVVTTPDWNSVHGSLTRYEKSAGKWKQLGGPVSIVVGKSGIGWTPALPPDKEAPVKHEGDGRSPAGIFRLTQTFGFADALPGAKDYLALTPAIECVDDVKSAHYAHIVDRSKVKVDWNSSEKMREISLYKWGVVVPYNMKDTKSGAGSCIFLHIAPSSGNGTAGCTAMPEANIEEIVRWIGKGAVLVQMPQAQYSQMKKQLGTP